MTEDEAQAWLRSELDVSRETFGRLETFGKMVIAENDRQNLISAGSRDHIWSRHIADSAQLLRFVPEDRTDVSSNGEHWLDLGTGAGFPGMILAILRSTPIVFVEARRRRVEFLRGAAKILGLDHVTVECCRLESLVARPFSTITARAFAPLPRLLHLAHSFSTEKTLWLLPKGAKAHEELESVRGAWQGVFHVEQSITDAAAGIIVAHGVKPKKKVR